MWRVVVVVTLTFMSSLSGIDEGCIEWRPTALRCDKLQLCVLIILNYTQIAGQFTLFLQNEGGFVFLQSVIFIYSRR